MATPFSVYIATHASAPGRIISATFAPPGGSAINLIGDGQGTFSFSQFNFATQSALDAAFPNGTYNFNIQTVTPPTAFNPTITISGDLYPGPPKMLNSNWVAGALQIDKTQDFTFTFNAVTGRGGLLRIYDNNGSGLVFSQSANPPATTAFMPAGTLQTGHTYGGSLYTYNDAFSTNGSTGLFADYFTTTYFSISAVGPPLITSPTTAAGIAGQQFVYQFLTSGATSVSVTNLPPGLSFNAALSVIVGTPTASGTFQVGLNASNSVGTTTATLSVNVQLPPAGPVIKSSTSATGRVAKPFNFQVITVGGSPATRVSATGLPPGLSLDMLTGIISGTPTTEVSSAVVLTATDGALTFSSKLQLTFTSDPALPVIVSPDSASISPGQPFSYKISAPTNGNDVTRFDGSYMGTYTDTSHTINGSVDFTVANGVINVTNPGTGTGTVSSSSGAATFTGSGAADGGSYTFSGTFSIAADGSASADGNWNATFSGGTAFGTWDTGRPPANIGRASSPTTNTVSNDPTTFTLIFPLPPGLFFDSATGVISGTFTPNSLRNNPMSPDRVTLSGGIVTNVQLFATNSHGTCTIPLTFFLAPTGAVNISTRLAVGTDNDVLIAGFILTGNAPKKVMICAIGPSTHVPGAMQDPTLELHDAKTTLGSNDDWRDNQEDEIIASTIPPTDDRESAIVAYLQAPGNYTAIVRGKDNTTGIAVVELYDLGTASVDASSDAKLAQISTRGTVRTQDDVMIGGFIISGPASKVIVRAIGPELNPFLSGALQDPTLELRDSFGSLISFNDDWKSTQQQQIIDTGVPPTDDREAAIIATLNPGAYTGIVRGKNNTIGVALVEVYGLK